MLEKSAQVKGIERAFGAAGHELARGTLLLFPPNGFDFLAFFRRCGLALRGLGLTRGRTLFRRPVPLRIALSW